MSEPRQTYKIKVPTNWSATQRRQFARVVIREIQARTDRGLDKNGNRFKGYSKSYINSLDFKIAGKSPSRVNLKLTGEMMNTMEVVSDAPGIVYVGYKAGTAENDKAAWARASDNGPSREFLGLPDSVLNKLIQDFSESFASDDRLDRIVDAYVNSIRREVRETLDDVTVTTAFGESEGESF